VALPAVLESIAGAQELYDWFTYWPDFHDAVVTKLHVEIGAPSSLVIHTWEMTNRVDPQGYYELTKHVVVEFVLDGVSTVALQDLRPNSILMDLVIEGVESGFRLILSSSYGLSGTIEAQGVSIHLTPGPPALSS
jgi:hypothetical protein